MDTIENYEIQKRKNKVIEAFASLPDSLRPYGNMVFSEIWNSWVMRPQQVLWLPSVESSGKWAYTMRDDITYRVYITNTMNMRGELFAHENVSEQHSDAKRQRLKFGRMIRKYMGIDKARLPDQYIGHLSDRLTPIFWPSMDVLESSGEDLTDVYERAENTCSS